MKIRVRFSQEGLFSGHTDEELYDIPASMNRYEEELTAFLADEYPNAEIEIVQSINDDIEVDGQPDHEEVAWVQDTVNSVYTNQPWEVKRAAD